MKKVILLTGNDLRHRFFKHFVSSNDHINVLKTFCENNEGDLNQKVSVLSSNKLRKKHLNSRIQTEIDFFELFINNVNDKSNSQLIQRGEVNNSSITNQIIELNPDLIVAYGCSIIKSEILEVFKNKFINIHLGLSPYYRGSGTNFWPFVENNLSLIGTTFMHIDKGIDTGEIIHQIRARIYSGDTIHNIGNRLIVDSVKECINIIKDFNYLKQNSNQNNKLSGKLFKNSDFTEESIQRAYMDLDLKIDSYLEKKKNLDLKFPLIQYLKK